MENMNLIHKAAWHFYKKTNIEYDELFGEAQLAYVEAIQRFDPKQGSKFTTFAYCHITNMLINFCKVESKRKSRTEFIESMIQAQGNGVDPTESLLDAFLLNYGLIHEERKSFFELIEDWPEDAKWVVKMILKNPAPITKQTPNFRVKYQATPHRSMRRLKAKLSDRGWTDQRIDKTINQIETGLARL